MVIPYLLKDKEFIILGGEVAQTGKNGRRIRKSYIDKIPGHKITI